VNRGVEFQRQRTQAASVKSRVPAELRVVERVTVFAISASIVVVVVVVVVVVIAGGGGGGGVVVVVIVIAIVACVWSVGSPLIKDVCASDEPSPHPQKDRKHEARNHCTGYDARYHVGLALAGLEGGGGGGGGC